jgi:toxin-antitoxin system PIN domain toxin
VIVPDANLLLYAFDAMSPRHQVALEWLESALSGPEDVGFPLVTLLAFVRIGTDPRVFAVPFEPGEAIGIVSQWLARPNVRVLNPTSSHWAVMRRLVDAGRARGPAITDAHIAALAEEHGAVVYSADRGFSRFAGVTVVDPTA